MTIYTNTATFTVARDIELGIECFGVWYRNDAMSYVVSMRGVPLMERFDNVRIAQLFFDLNLERMKVEEANFQQHALNIEQPE